MTEAYHKEPYKEVAQTLESSWKSYLDGLHRSLDQVEKDLDEAAQMSSICTSEWCTATEHVLDELANSLFSIHEPRFAADEDSAKLKQLKKRVHDLYAKYKAVAA